MRLVHFTEKPLDELRAVEQLGGGAQKPRGLWCSDESQYNGWRWWCEGMEWHERLTHAYVVTLAEDARILHLWPHDLAEFGRKHRVRDRWADTDSDFIPALDWRPIAARWQGIALSPYDRDAALGSLELMWAYSFDCASACIWDPAAIASVVEVFADEVSQ